MVKIVSTFPSCAASVRENQDCHRSKHRKKEKRKEKKKRKKKKKKKKEKKKKKKKKEKKRRREIRIRLRMIYSFRPLPLMKGCGWMTYHLTVHTIIVPMSKKTNKLTTVYLTSY